MPASELTRDGPRRQRRCARRAPNLRWIAPPPAYTFAGDLPSNRHIPQGRHGHDLERPGRRHRTRTHPRDDLAAWYCQRRAYTPHPTRHDDALQRMLRLPTPRQRLKGRAVLLSRRRRWPQTV